MNPAQPPFPLPTNLPFQPEAGIQTSILISESALGFNVTATRQNAGKSLYGGRPSIWADDIGTGLAGVNAPAATDCAKVIVASGRESEARLSHETAAAAGPAEKTTRISR